MAHAHVEGLHYDAPGHFDDIHPWDDGLCQWFRAPLKCLALCCCPCAIGAVRSKYLNGSLLSLDCCCDGWFGCLNPFHFFSQVRRDRKIKGSQWVDCALAWCCFPCHGTRVWREVDRTVNGRHGLAGVPPSGSAPWSSKCTDCRQDLGGCALAACAYCLIPHGCPCLFWFVTANTMHKEDGTSLIPQFLCCLQHAYLRNVVRRDYGIRGNYIFDCLWSCIPFIQCFDLARIIRQVETAGPVCRDRRHLQHLHEERVIVHHPPPPIPIHHEVHHHDVIHADIHHDPHHTTSPPLYYG